MQNEKFDMQDNNARQEKLISDQRRRIEDLEREINKHMLDE